MPPNTLTHTFLITPSSPVLTLRPQFKQLVSHFGHPRLSLEPSSYFSPLTLRKGRTVVAEGFNGEEYAYPQNDSVLGHEDRKLRRPCEVYVCNFPRSFNAAHLFDMFRPYGTILSVEICRNAKTEESKGCGYVTMGSVYSARVAVAALDGSDVGGREMRVRLSVEMNPERNSSTQKTMYYEAPHKLYVGNLPKSARPEQLRNLFSRFGNIAGAVVLHDHKHGKGRVYAFLSFESETERNAARSLDGTEFYGRKLIVKEGVERTEASAYA
ncbi:hypothetical protein VNO77_06695 [Canavalia gladiata]|uniref:RRM domain-containing protein n=1 Tax=Canavalia gladiata TaxID=3824 RepID=A0AAN9MAM3_CANGL